jgi:pimeloyl-ACP methyl ester carboxylesterase
MSNFVLVHGSWHGAWCWFKVVPRLRALGHRVEAVDLSGHGRDRADLAAVTLDDYVASIGEAIERIGEPVIVVAHSRGGIAASQAAERFHDQVERVVYLAAYLLADGETVLDHVPHDHDSLVVPQLYFAPDGSWDMLRAEAFEPALYADCSPEDVELAHRLLTPEPSLPSRTPLALSDERYGSVPRAYVELLDDRAVSLALQRRMQAAMPCEDVVAIESSHSAYFSRPDELAGRLDELSRGDR